MIVPVEIDDELLAQAEGSAKKQGVAFKEFVSMALRGAIAQAKFTPPRTFTQKVHDFGAHLESPWSLLAELETNPAAVAKK